MRLLHTADWHLGHRLYDRDRTDEHRAALAWLLETIEAEKVDLLIVAGDIFDVTNPSNQARELYYDFLGKLLRAGCSAAVIIGGNHDSPAMLDAPSGLMRALQLHVVGSARTQVQSEVIKIRVQNKENSAVLVAAVPYLRERDVRKSSFGESSEDRLTAIRDGIREHYRLVGEAAEQLREDPTTPIVGTGHLFAAGAADAEDKKSHIYQADEHNIEAGQFPGCFDYVALGHVHRAQSVDDQPHVRYSGSLIPLTFVEGQRPRSVRLVELGQAGEPVTSRKIELPFARQLYRIHGDLEKVKNDLRTYATLHTQPITSEKSTSANKSNNHESPTTSHVSPLPRTSEGSRVAKGAGGPPKEDAKRKATSAASIPTSNEPTDQITKVPTLPLPLPPWAEVRVRTDERIPNLRQTLLDSINEVTPDGASSLPLEIIRISTERLTPAPAAAPENTRQLDELDPEDVFARLLTTEGTAPETTTELLQDFRDLRSWMTDQPDAQ